MKDRTRGGTRSPVEVDMRKDIAAAIDEVAKQHGVDPDDFVNYAINKVLEDEYSIFLSKNKR